MYITDFREPSGPIGLKPVLTEDDRFFELVNPQIEFYM